MYLKDNKHLILAYFILIAVNSFGQNIEFPKSNIHLLNFESINGEIEVGDVKFLTNFNPDHYNNQPSFVSDNRILISSQFNDEFIDILDLNLLNNSFNKFTNTKNISEFSPKLMLDKETVSVVRIEENGTSQSLWLYPLDRSTYGHRVLENLSNIGYYEWLDDKNVAIFQVGDPIYLKVFNIDSQIGQTIATNIGRCIKRISAKSFYFVSKAGQILYLKKYDLLQNKSQIVSEIQSEDFDIDQNGNIFTIVDDMLKVLKSQMNPKWETVVNLKNYGILNADRITIFNNQMAIVSTNLND